MFFSQKDQPMGIADVCLRCLFLPYTFQYCLVSSLRGSAVLLLPSLSIYFNMFIELQRPGAFVCFSYETVFLGFLLFYRSSLGLCQLTHFSLSCFDFSLQLLFPLWVLFLVSSMVASIQVPPLF